MLQKIIITVSVVSILTFTQSANAIFMIEPSIGYRQETVKLTDILPPQNQTEIKMNSPTYGLKLGFTSAMGISFDLAGNRSSGKAEYTPALTESPNYSHNIGSIQVGVNAMGLLKIYLGYIAIDDLEIQTNNFIQGFKMKGHGFQAGLMTFPFQRVGLGIQYNVHQFTEISGANFTNGPDIKNYFDKIDVQDISASISFLF